MEMAGEPRPGHSEETQWLNAVADQQVFGLLVVIEHHFMRLTTNT